MTHQEQAPSGDSQAEQFLFRQNYCSVDSAEGVVSEQVAWNLPVAARSRGSGKNLDACRDSSWFGFTTKAGTQGPPPPFCN